AVMMPVGRVGCLIAGCCTGAVCPSWMSAVCVPAADDPTTRVHLLPAYFAALGLALVVVHVSLLRRGARPGTLIAVGFLLYPLGPPAIEQLRPTTDSRGDFMQLILAGTVLVDLLIVAAWVGVRRMRAHRASEVGPGHAVVRA